MPGAGRKLKTVLALFCAAGLLLGPAADLRNGMKGYIAGAEKDAAKNPALALAMARLGSLERPMDPFAPDREGRAAAVSGELGLAEAAFRRALALEPNFAGARLDLSLLLAVTGRGSEACGELVRLEDRPAAGPRNDYERGLLGFDQQAAEKLEKDICGKKKTGAATARRRPTR